MNPKLLLLDEPSQGLAPLIVQEVFKVVTSAREQGISVLLVEQNVRAAVEIADRAYVFDDGSVVYSGAASEFAKDEERVRALAGASAEDMGAARLARLVPPFNLTVLQSGPPWSRRLRLGRRGAAI